MSVAIRPDEDLQMPFATPVDFQRCWQYGMIPEVVAKILKTTQGMYIVLRSLGKHVIFPYMILILRRGRKYHSRYSGISKVRKVFSSCRRLVLGNDICLHGALAFDSGSGCESLNVIV